MPTKKVAKKTAPTKVAKKAPAKKAVTKVAKKAAPKKAVKKAVAKKAPAKKAPKKEVLKNVVRTAAKGAKAKAAGEKQDKAEHLIKKGKERGYITYSEILKEFPHIEDDVDFFDDLYQRFMTSGIDVDRKSVV